MGDRSETLEHVGSVETRGVFARVRRLAFPLVIAAYLGCIAFSFFRHVLGDPGEHPIAYFWTWDMFAGHPAESSRRLVIAKTDDGRFVQFIPGSGQRFRWGRGGDATRIDLDRRTVHLRAAVEYELRCFRSIAPDRPLERIYVVEQYWPARFNLPDGLYEATYREPNPRRKYWRVLHEADISGGQLLRWEEPP